ncbi:hypothetical protein HBO14_11095 [Pseudomonas sp. WS 5406]|uniref:hypothetical protein n=1 Tax=Pseudomonas sp. WS 5406 TaxID=2717498 RepID=UPI0014739B94|nr:hypothetical protein [Pseudomonas sp. WS 5406]NMX27071.1 hypothetical protein [Pseudomonas sp. WS 5406]
MSEFKREERYIVVKLKHLAGLQVAPLRNFLRENRVPTLDCVVVEQDWPEYEEVWRSIERRMTGQPAVSAAEELDAVRHWRSKHTQAIRERGALQALLTAADEMADHNARVSAIAVEDVLLLQKRADVLETALAGMLFAFDDGVGRDWSATLLDFARTLTPAKEFKVALKPAEGGGDE